ncbi:Kef-type transport system [Natronomonas pharaonis DSM 2160]|uniref:Kef-type transport system n=1 Tax=Natronomonas pharaonis (strain ATCC 35678 / DSM 2160 / CIP 103997 / JCM 8858 / NBRC 14720 / NCIMB 2260 / Gabara) TaxID=348780 RepID=A0A1U7ETM1_NATPD|nr:cation:proton antiporter [Natronomonas pharaonis]CAI48257.1 Kef-type transport system [Natronomonas pharaonis DSM 2160]
MSDLLTIVSVMFIVAGPFLLLANRYDIPAVPLLILAGIVAGRFFEEQGLVLELARYGVALLVFSFGVGIQLDSLRTVLADSELAALGQIGVVGALGTGFGVVVGLPPVEAALFGIAAALSSTIVATALLQREIWMDLVHGRLAESINFVQDLFAVGVLLIISAEAFAADPIATQLGYGLVLFAAAVAINRYLFDALGRLAGGSDELMIIGAVSLLVVFIGAAEVFGVSIAVGAFAAGLAIRHEPGTHLGLFNGVESLKDFFVAIFFVTVGALVVVPFVDAGTAESINKLLLAGGLVVLAGLVKPAVTIAILMYKGYEARTATLTGATSDQVSEFALIIAIEAFLLGLLTQITLDAVVLAAVVTMVTSSLTQRHDEAIYRWLSKRGLLPSRHGKVDSMSDVPDDISDHIVVVGYGHTGKPVVAACEELDVPYVVIENDPARHDAVQRECDAYIFGDAMDQYTWEKANVTDAALVMSMVDFEPVSQRLLSFDLEADLVLRAGDEQTALRLLDAGATYVSVPDLLASEELIGRVRAVLEGETTPAELRAEQRERLK